MSLVHCPDCGTQVSEHADICNKCSYPIRKLKMGSNATQIHQVVEVTHINSNNALIISGYVMAFISLLFYPIIFSPAGIIIGIISISKGMTGHGIAHIILSLILGIIGFILGAIAFML